MESDQLTKAQESTDVLSAENAYLRMQVEWLYAEASESVRARFARLQPFA